VRTRAPALVLGLCLAAAAAGPAPGPAPGAAGSSVEAYFTPGDDVERVIADRIAGARRSVQVEAYLFTNRRIAAALAKAARRGVAVDLVGDAKQHESGGFPVLRSLERAGVRVWMSERFAAFHNKVILVDADSAAAIVITGSYNFTRSAQERNAENVVVIAGNEALAARYARDFERHRLLSRRLQ